MALPLHPAVSSAYAEIPFEKSYTLSRSIAAIPVLATPLPQLGLMTRLPEGAELELRGAGFDDQTIRVSWAGQSYFVFLADLESRRKPAAFAAAV
ncbi:MAG TPA: hypothetical protein VKX25_08820 [Bryobacteraceae bacterium]|jgi:hypothetical protein|nr:hypothetical protein [Bryobacteraceae bacterium]